MTSSSSSSPSLSFLICTTCGTQYPSTDRTALTTCFICDDPRQYVPSVPGGRPTFTTLEALQRDPSVKNEFHPLSLPSCGDDNRFVSVVTTPKFGIGQRAVLVRTTTASGKKVNVLWDCLSYIDDETIETLRRRWGGLHAVVISHPHYYSSHLEWADRFDCPVYLAAEDERWLARRDNGKQVFLREVETSIVVDGENTGVKVIKLGGHFPGSLVLLYDGRLLTADTVMMTPSGRSNWTIDALGRPRERPKGVNTFSFMWSIPNMIPLSADEVVRMWEIIKDYDYKSAHGPFLGWDIEGEDLKARMLESMQIQVRAMGYAQHPFLQLSL
ncbi:hypothetical protein VTI28DRAFT_183 [Corynascus sepedonium]